MLGACSWARCTPALRLAHRRTRAPPASPHPACAASIVWASATSSLILAWLLAWSGSWFGVDAYRLLHDPVDVAAAAPTWLAWTVPYVGGTLGEGRGRCSFLGGVGLPD